jgi:hypothetical protein
MTAGEENAQRRHVPEACEQLQAELDALLVACDGDAAVQSLDTAVASMKEVEQRNVSSVQLVALDLG